MTLHTSSIHPVEGSVEAKARRNAGRSSSLAQLALRGSMVEVLGFGASQVLRLGSNLILSRLLFPEAFGLAALVSIFNQALVMFSDVGIEPGVIQSARGDEESFLKTAWTMQVVRGVGLWLCACLLAVPLSSFYSEPELSLLIPVGSLGVVALGFSSTSLYTLRRHMRIGQLIRIDLISQFAGTACIVLWAYAQRTVWALVGGSVVTAATKMWLSYRVSTPFRHRFAWEPEARTAIIHFGRWIFGASALFFLSKQGDRILLGRYLGLSVLGVYSIAVMLSEALGTVVGRVTTGVLYPVFSRAYREQPDALPSVYYRARGALDAVALPALGAMTVLGSRLIDLLYDTRYAEAGWMLEVLCVRVAMSCVLLPCETCLTSMGNSRYSFFDNLARAAWVLLAIPLGFELWGVEGIVWGTALSEIPVLLVLAPPFFRFKLLRPLREALAPMWFGLGVALGYAVDTLFWR